MNTILTIAQHYYRGGYNVMGLVRYRETLLKNGKLVWKKAECLDCVAPRTGNSKKFVRECESAAESLGEDFRLGVRDGQLVD